MAGDNPFPAEIRKLNSAAEDLLVEAARVAPGLAQATMLARARAKLDVAIVLQNLSYDWEVDRTQPVLDGLERLLDSDAAVQAEVVERLSRILRRHGRADPGRPVPDTAGEDEPPDDAGPAEPEPELPPRVDDAIPAPRVEPGGAAVMIELTDEAVDALARVAQSEVGHFTKYDADTLKGGVRAVVETILNRVAHPRFPGGNVFEIVDQPKQFSAINSVGSWRGLPAAKPAVRSIVTDYLAARAGGAAATLGGATHFLNPFVSSPSAVAAWGQHVVDNAAAVFGNVARKDVHYHGFAPGYALPRPYVISVRGKRARFRGDGTPTATAAAAPGAVRARIIEICNAQWEFFERGAKKESSDPHYLRVGEYWSAVGEVFNGRTMLRSTSGAQYSPAWSSAFISYVIKTAGLGDRFLMSQGHCHYVQDLIAGRPRAAYEAVLAEDYAPRPGDIVHFGREWAETFGYAEAVNRYRADKFYPSHSDIVTEVDAAKNVLYTIGGNVSDSVGRGTVPLVNGLLAPRKGSRNRKLPWICVLKLVAG